MRALFLIIIAHTAVLLLLFLVLWGLIQVIHFLFPERPQIVYYLEAASELGFLLLFLIWTSISVISYALAEKRKIYTTSIEETTNR